MKRFALAGNPNCGKTTLFNALTGSTAHVGNWPGVTVESRDGIYKKGSEPVKIVDLPGIYSLSPYTDEEVISRNYILNEKPECIINIIDATNLERNLYLSTQILEIDVPVIIALNMIDEVRKNGENIDVNELSKKLGVPVVEISALTGENIDEMMKVAIETSSTSRKGTTVLADNKLMHLIGDINIAFSYQKVENSLFHAIKLVELDELEVKDHPDLVSEVEEFKNTFDDETFGNDFEAVVADARYKYISEEVIPNVKKGNKREVSMDVLTKSDKIDRVLTNKWAGIPMFLIILFAVFHLTFSENLFFLGGLFENVAPSFEGSIFEGLIWTDAGINSPGVILFNLLTCVTDWLSSLAGTGLEALGADPEGWVVGFIVDGALGGIFSVLSFLPQILVLFAFFSILEDSGYMARVAFILDRLLRKFGVSGRSILPMIMGFGCSVPAMINTRTLSDDKEKVATIRVIPFFSCGAKLPILIAISGGIVQTFGIGNADVITFSMYAIGMTAAMIAIVVMKRTTMKGDIPPFIMELPTYHLPQFRALCIHVWDKLKHFVKKAFTIILASTIIVWFLSNVGFGSEFGDMENSILGWIGKVMQPIFTPLGFGSQLGKLGWVFAVAIVTGLIAKENVIATFGSLAAALTVGFVADDAMEGIDSANAIITAITLDGGTITWAALLSFIVFNMTTIPCFSAVATAKAELPRKQIWKTIGFWLLASYLASAIVYTFLLPFADQTKWWSLFVCIGLILLIVVYVYVFNKIKSSSKKVA